jgi:hypothetical protein
MISRDVVRRKKGTVKKIFLAQFQTLHGQKTAHLPLMAAWPPVELSDLRNKNKTLSHLLELYVSNMIGKHIG